MVATSGSRLLDEDGGRAADGASSSRWRRSSRRTWTRRRVLLGRGIDSRDGMETAARELSASHHCAVLLKGGHLSGDEASDVLVQDGVATWFEGRRISGVRTHGTGCTLSAAITAGLGKGLALARGGAAGKTVRHSGHRRSLSLGRGGCLEHDAVTSPVNDRHGHCRAAHYAPAIRCSDRASSSSHWPRSWRRDRRV